jgi:predicted metal-dependent peptidase
MTTTINRDELTVKAIERIAKARAEIVLTNTFYGVALGQVEPLPNWNFPTMATNGKVHYFNPEFITGLSFDETVFVQKHENEHDVRRHHTRRGNRDPLRWNKATDYAINIDLVDGGDKPPEKIFLDARFRGMSAEDIYRTLEIEEAEEQRKRQEAEDEESSDQPEQSPDEGSDEGEDENDNADEADDGEGDDDPQEGADQSDDEEESDEDGEGEQQGEAPGQDGEGDQGGDAPGGDDGQPGEGTGEGAGETKGEAEGDGTGEGSDGAEGDASGNAGGSGMPGEGEGMDPRSSGDPGNCGETIDASSDPGEIADSDARWQRVFRQASMLAAKRGGLPGHVAREIQRADREPENWRDVLRRFFDNGATTIETWNKPNRRFVSSGLYLPGTQRDGLNRVAILIDTSGSVTWYPGSLEAIQTECQAVLDERIVDELVVVYGDVRVTRVDTYGPGDTIDFDPKGGGGTMMRPLFDYVRTELDNVSLVLAFTDLEIESEAELGPEPHCPTLWACVGFPARVKQYLLNTPWGSPGIEVTPH